MLHRLISLVFQETNWSMFLRSASSACYLRKCIANCIEILKLYINVLNFIISSWIIFNWFIKKVLSINHKGKSFVSSFGRKYLAFVFLTASSSNDRTKSLFTPSKLGSTKQFKYQFFLSINSFDWNLVQLIVILKADFNWSCTFTLSW